MIVDTGLDHVPLIEGKMVWPMDNFVSMLRYNKLVDLSKNRN